MPRNAAVVGVAAIVVAGVLGCAAMRGCPPVGGDGRASEGAEQGSIDQRRGNWGQMLIRSRTDRVSDGLRSFGCEPVARPHENARRRSPGVRGCRKGRSPRAYLRV